MSGQDWDEAEVLLRTWLRRAREGQHMHYEAAKQFRRAYYLMSVPVLLITSIIGTAAFATITSSLSSATKGWLGALSLFAAALTALQLNLRYLERAEKHKNVGAQFAHVRRDMEAMLALSASTRPAAKDALADVATKLDRISSDAEVVSRRIYDKTLSRLAARDRAKSTNPRSLPHP